MKKVFVVLVSLFAFFVTGCENFLQSSSLKDSIEQQIDYAGTEHFFISSYYPKNSVTGACRNSSVIINFDQPVPSISDSDIKICDEKGDVVSGNGADAIYKTPALSDDKTSVRIDPVLDSDNKTKIQFNDGNTRKFTVVINPLLKSSKGAFIDNSANTFSFVINTSTDNVAPIVRNDIKIETDSVEGKFSDDNKLNINREKQVLSLENNVAGTIYISGSIFDAESGVSKVEISMNKSESPLAKPQTKEYVSSLTSTNDGYYVLKEEKISLADFDEIPDGKVTVEIRAVDLCGNKSEPVKLSFVKDTVCDSSKVFIYSKNYEYYENDKLELPVSVPFKISDQDNATKTIYWSQAVDNGKEIAAYEISYGNSTDNMCDFTSEGIKEFKTYKYNGQTVWKEYCFNLCELEKIKDTYIKIKVIDEAGNESIRKMEIPASPEIVGITKNGDGAGYDLYVKENSKLPVLTKFDDDRGFLVRTFRVYASSGDGNAVYVDQNRNDNEDFKIGLTSIPDGTDRLAVEEVYVNTNQAYYDYFVDNHPFVDFENYLGTMSIKTQKYYFPITNMNGYSVIGVGYGNYTFSQLSDFVGVPVKDELAKPVIASVSLAIGENADPEFKSLTGPNSKMAQVTVTLNNEDSGLNYTYHFGTLMSETNEFLIPVNTNSRYIYVVAHPKNKNSNINSAQSEAYDITSLLDESVDTEPPIVSLLGTNFYSNKNFCLPLLIENKIGKIREDENGYASIFYYDVPINGAGYGETLSDEEKSKYTKDVVYFDQGDPYHIETSLSLYNYDTGKYYCAYIDAEDRMHNTYSEYSGKFIYSLAENSPVLTYDSGNDKIKVKTGFNFESKGTEWYYLDKYWSATKKMGFVST